MLQHLERSERDAKLLARFGVFKRCGIQFSHCSDGFRAERCNSAVAAGLQSGDALTVRSQQVAGWDLHIHQRDLGGAPAIYRLEALPVEICRLAIKHKEADATPIARL